MEPQVNNEAVPTTNDEGVSADAGSDSAAETTSEGAGEVTAAEETTEPQTTEEVANVDAPTDAETPEAEPETTLDEELSQDAEVTVAGIPEGTVTPENAPEAEFLAVVNSTGFVKGVLPREQAIEAATKGGFSVRAATEDEVKTVS